MLDRDGIISDHDSQAHRVKSKARDLPVKQALMAGRKSILNNSRSTYSPEVIIAAMSEHKATISWTRTSPDFLKGKYSREHTWTFDGGATVPASPSPSGVPAPYSNAAYVDPEEAFVADRKSTRLNSSH